MIALRYNHTKAVRWTWILLLVAGAVWFAQHHRPGAESLAAREALVAEREARVRQARTAVVVLGPAGLDSALAQFRADSALLSLRVPADSAGFAVAAEVKAMLGAREGRGLRIARTEAIPPSAEGGFTVAGYAVTAIGRFGAIRGLLGELAAQPRLLRVRRLRLAVVPDSLVAGAHGPAGGPGFPADSSSATVVDGAEPFEAVVTFQVLWYTRPTVSSAAVLDSTRAGGATPSTALLP